MSEIYATAGERIVTPDGKYLGTVARDLLRTDKRWSPDDFTDLQIDTNRPSQRLPLTSWLVRRLQPHG